MLADADCFYPKKWIDIMGRNLMKKDVVFVCGKYSFFGSDKTPRWKMAGYEFIRDIMVEVKQFKRPYLNAFGISMGYVKELGIKEGYLQRNIRGEDGRLCFDLMKYGKVRLVRSDKARAWTGIRTLERDGSFSEIVKKRILRELARLTTYFKTPEPHDTKTSDNTEYSPDQSVKLIKERFNPLRILRRKKQTT